MKWIRSQLIRGKYVMIHLRGTSKCKCDKKKYKCRSKRQVCEKLSGNVTGCCARRCPHNTAKKGKKKQTIVGAHVILAEKLPSGQYRLLWHYGTFLFPTCNSHNIDINLRKVLGFLLPFDVQHLSLLVPFRCNCGFAPDKAYLSAPAFGNKHPTVANDPGF
jgi:hypothetical protein